MRRISFSSFFLGLAIFLGAGLRFYRLPELMPFNGEIGRDLLAVRDILVYGQLPPFGPPTSLTWLRLGPFSYYLFAPALFVGRFHPLSAAILAVIFDIAAILLIYLLAKRFLDQKAGIFASLLYAASPFAIIHSRIALHVSLVPLFTLLFLIFWERFLKTNQEKFFYFSLLIGGILVQLHLVTMVLVTGFVLLSLGKVRLRQLAVGLIFFLIPLLPFLYADVTNNFSMTVKLFAWFPYRVLSAFGFFTEKNILGPEKIFKFSQTVLSFFQRTVFWANSLVAAFLGLSGFFSVVFAKRRPLMTRNIIVVFALSLGAILIHGESNEHYFIYFSSILILLVAFWLTKLGRIGLGLTALIIIINIGSVASHGYFSETPLGEEIKIARFIINDSKSNSYQLIPPPDIVGLPDYYKHFKYLGWWLGKEPAGAGRIAYSILDAGHKKMGNILGLPIYESENFAVVKLP